MPALKEKVGRVLSATFVAAAVPYTRIPKLLNKTNLGLLRQTRAGMSRSKALREKDLPAAVDDVRKLMRHKMDGKLFSVSVDGGNAPGLLHGSKILAINAVGPALEFDMLIGTPVLGGTHENADIQAYVLNETLLAQGCSKKWLRFVVADNAAVNEASVKILNERYGWNVEYRRCIPHLLNRLMVAFLLPFDEKFKIQSFLKAIRAFFTAGGAAARKIFAVEAGIVLSSIDCTDTRWASLLKAIAYMCSVQSPAHIKTAKERLLLSITQLESHLAATPETSAPLRARRAEYTKRIAEMKEAAADESQKRVWDVVYEVVEAIKSDELADAECGSLPQHMVDAGFLPSSDAKPQPLLDDLADPVLLASFYIISNVTDGVNGIFKLLQGGAQWSAKLDDLKGTNHSSTVAPVRKLVAMFRSLNTDGDALKQTVDSACNEALESVKLNIRRGVEYGEIAEEDVDDAIEAAERRLEEGAEKLTETLKAAVAAVVDSAALKKMDAALKNVDVKFRYDINVKPSAAPDDFLSACDFFGVDETWVKRYAAPGTSLATYINNCRDEWKSHCAGWTPPPVDGHAPSSVYAYWDDLRAALPSLVPVALHHYSSPLSGCASERTFSIFTDMDKPKARRTKEPTLKSTLFLRANARLVEEGASNLAADISLAAESSKLASSAPPRSPGKKRARVAIESAEAALAKAAARALAARSKRPRRRYRAMTDDEESSSDDGEAVLGDSSAASDD